MQERRDRGKGSDRGRSEQVQGDDSAASFTAIFREHHRACFRLARRVVKDEAMAHDVVQDVFLTWWRTDGGSYSADRGELAPWLSTLTHHKAVDAVRAAERQRRLQRISASEAAEQEHLPDELVWWEMGRQALLAALPRLTAKQREVLSLAYGSGLTQLEIAEQLGIPLGTVKSRTHAGLLRLRAAMSSTWTPTGPVAKPQDRPDRNPSPVLLDAERAATAGAATEAVTTCSLDLVRVAAESGDGPSSAVIVERAQVLVAEHGEAALYALVVALARTAAGTTGARGGAGRTAEAGLAHRPGRRLDLDLDQVALVADGSYAPRS